MKLTKRPLALLLAIALAFALAVPAMAQALDIRDITAQDLRINTAAAGNTPYGEAFTISVEFLIDLPQDVELSFQWKHRTYERTEAVAGATAQALTVPPESVYYPAAPGSPIQRPRVRFECDVTLKQPDGQGGFRTNFFRLWSDVDLQAQWPDFFVERPPASLELPNGEDIALSVLAQAPAGIEIKYWWTDSSGAVIAEGPQLRIPPGSARYPKAARAYDLPPRLALRYHIACYETGGQVEVYSYRSDYVMVQVGVARGPNFWEVFGDTFMKSISLFVAWPGSAVLLSTYGGPAFLIPMAVLLAPVILVGALIGTLAGVPWGLIEGLKSQFS